MKAGESVATIDLDSRQKSFTRYIENRRGWAERVGRDLGIPDAYLPRRQSRQRGRRRARRAQQGLDRSRRRSGAELQHHRHRHPRPGQLPGAAGPFDRRHPGHAANDSFVDFDVLGNVDPTSFAVTGTSHYARLVEEARAQRQLLDGAATDWIVLRNRLVDLRLVAQQAAGRRGAAGTLATAEFPLRRRPRRTRHLPRVLSARLDRGRRSRRITLGTRPTMSHATARLEMENLLGAILLGARGQTGTAAERDAA